MLREDIEALVAQTYWYHSIDLGQGVVTPGASTNRIEHELLPDVVGKSVLDIGAWDGLYSFWAERVGAARVVAMDRYVWGVDIVARDRYWNECAARGEFPDHDLDGTAYFDPSLPWRRGFDIAHEVLDSKVEPIVADFPHVDAEAVGTFDVTLCLGVLYHLPDPYGALRTLRLLTAGVAVIETEGVALLEQEEVGLCQFLPGSELNADFGNWFVISEAALVGMCRAAGFSRVEVLREPPPPVPAPAPITWRSTSRDRQNHENTQADRRRPRYYRIVVHAFV